MSFFKVCTKMLVKCFIPNLYGHLINLTFFGGKALVNKLWPLLFKWAKLDLRLTKHILKALDPLNFVLHFESALLTDSY